MFSNCDAENSLESLGLQRDQASPSYRKSALNIHWKDWCWSWSSNSLATWCKEPTHWKRLWCWERLRAEGEDWMASPTQWTWVWVNCGSWWWTGRPGVLQSMGSQRVGHDWATGLNWLKDTKWNFSSNVRQHPLWYSYFMIIKKVSVNRLWQLFFFKAKSMKYFILIFLPKMFQTKYNWEKIMETVFIVSFKE